MDTQFYLRPTRKSNLNFACLIIYSYLWSQARFDRPISHSQIAKNTKLDRKRIPAIIHQLIELGLVEKTNQGAIALAPPDGWFHTRKGEVWYDALAFTRGKVCPDKGRTGKLTPAQNAIYWTLKSYNHRQPNNRGLATQLCLNRTTVYRAKKRLAKLGLLDSHGKITAEKEKDIWRGGGERSETAKQDNIHKSNGKAANGRQCSPIDKEKYQMCIEERLDHETALACAEQARHMDVEEFTRVGLQSRNEHNKNQDAGKWTGFPHYGHLFLHKLRQRKQSTASNIEALILGAKISERENIARGIGV